MLCDICKKNQATIHIHEIKDGTKKEFNLCAECAAKKQAGFDFGAFNLGEILFNLGNHASAPAKSSDEQEKPAEPSPVCTVCGWTVEKIRESGGRLGCADCYKTFRKLIDGALASVQRGRMHQGKRPGAAPCKNSDKAFTVLEITAKESELKQAVSAEDYERAAALRDDIASLKKRIAPKQRNSK